MPSLRPRPKQILIGFDQFVNTWFGGWADETFSARCWRLRNYSRPWSWARCIVDTILWFDKNHCMESWKSEQNRTQLPGSYLKSI